MSTIKYQLSWDSFKNNVCDGFTNLQQNEEFVDMTLAADGCLVKVHKNIFALASPYIKSLLKSIHSAHSVFFLSNVSYDILNYILTYVYTGEVSVEVDKIQAFMRVAKELRLSGLSGMPVPKVGPGKTTKSSVNKQNYVDPTTPHTQTAVDERVANNAVLIDMVNATESALTNIELLDTAVSAGQINASNVENGSSNHMSISNINKMDTDLTLDGGMLDNRKGELYTTADGYQYKLEVQYGIYSNSNEINNTSEMITSNGDTNFGSFEDEYNKMNDTNNICSASKPLKSLQPEDITLQYSESSRGSLQLILNRFMYYSHHQSHHGKKRRWRCIEYRSKHCPAYIDTDGEIMTSRKFQHCHPFHDEKIRKKMINNLIYTNVNLILEKQKERKKTNSVLE